MKNEEFDERPDYEKILEEIQSFCTLNKESEEMNQNYNSYVCKLIKHFTLNHSNDDYCTDDEYD